MKFVNRNVIVTAAFATFTLLSADVLGQRRVISYREYSDGIQQKQEVPWDERTRRVETLREELINGAVSKSDLHVSEIVLPDRQRSYTRKVEDGKVKEFESITIGYFWYTRKDGGEWTKTDLRQAAKGSGYGSGNGSGSGSSGRVTCKQYSVEHVVISGTPVKLYEMIELLNVGNELTFAEMRNWVANDGVPYRSEHVKGMAFPRVETWREVITYDYSDLKIEAPIP